MKAGFLGVLAILAAGYTLLAFQLDALGPAGSPGPGFLPRLLGVALLVALLPDALGVLRSRGSEAHGGDEAPAGAGAVVAGEAGGSAQGAAETGAIEPTFVALPRGRIAVAVGLLALLLVALLPVLGTVPTSMLFLFVTLGILNPGSHRWNGLLSVAVPAALYVVFTLWLGVQLPAGVFARWF